MYALYAHLQKTQQGKSGKTPESSRNRPRRFRLGVELDPRYAFVVAGGALSDPDIRYAHDADLIVAADSGASFLKKHNVIPDIIVGDFDSLSPSVLEHFRTMKKGVRKERPVEVIKLPREKDKTDTEVALDIISDRGFSAALVVGGLGGFRLDHELANVFILEPYAKLGLDVVLCSTRSIIFGVHGVSDEYKTPYTARSFIGLPGDWVSVIPLTSEVAGVTLSGLKFPLYEATLKRGSTLGVSNEMVKEKASISVTEGFALVVLTVG